MQGHLFVRKNTVISVNRPKDDSIKDLWYLWQWTETSGIYIFFLLDLFLCFGVLVLITKPPSDAPPIILGFYSSWTDIELWSCNRWQKTGDTWHVWRMTCDTWHMTFLNFLGISATFRKRWDIQCLLYEFKLLFCIVNILSSVIICIV